MIHAVHTNNMSEMGGLRKKMPITFWTFLIGSLALAGVPPLAGFWSKDELLVVANEGGHDVLFVVLLLTALLTAFYMTRAVLMTFFGEFRGHGEPHEGPRTMTGLLVALATVTVFVGLLGAPQLGAPFGTWVFFHEIEEALFVPWIAVASTLAALLGIAIGYRLYTPIASATRSVRSGRRTRCSRTSTTSTTSTGRASSGRSETTCPRRVLERPTIIDGVVNGAASFTKTLGNGVNWFDEKVIDGAVNGLANLAGFTGGLLRYIQSGNVQRYAVFLFVGVVVLAVVFTKLRLTEGSEGAMTWENSAITITTLLPLAGALVIALVPRRYETGGPRARHRVHGRGARLRDRDRVRVRLRRPRACSSSSTRAGSPRSAPATTWGSTASACRCTCSRSLLSFLCAIYTWRFVPEPGRTKAFLALMLLLETGMAGTFIAFDLILFFVFWELVLVPMYFLIGIWGSRQPRVRRDQVLPVHAVRVGVHAAGLPGDVLQLGSEPAHVRHRRAPAVRGVAAASRTTSSWSSSARSASGSR